MSRIIQGSIASVVVWYKKGNRWWIPLLCGMLYTLCLPPFNHESHPLLGLFPFLSFFVLIPFLGFCLEEPRKRGLMKAYAYGFGASATQFYWLINTHVQGVWLMILLGLIVLVLFWSLNYLLYGAMARFVFKNYKPWIVIPLYPSLWIVWEYVWTLSDMAFPWGFIGYSFSAFLPMAQLASLTGVHGISFVIVMINVVLFYYIRDIYLDRPLRMARIACIGGILCIAGIILWGSIRIRQPSGGGESLKIACIQSNIDPMGFEAEHFLDTSMAVNERLIMSTIHSKPDVIVLSESGVWCYVDYDPRIKAKVLEWTAMAHAPVLFGTLDYKRTPQDPVFGYRVYNALFLSERDYPEFSKYYKVKLVPFSESLPFEGMIPLLNRINLGQSDFFRGTEEKVFVVGNRYRVAPFICFEIFFPDFVRRRVKNGAQLLLTVSQDAWWGKSNAPFIMAAMARMRGIECGVPLVRCANSGVSIMSDPYGRIYGKTVIFTRTTLIRDITVSNVETVYRRWGDWLPYAALVFALASFITYGLRRFRIFMTL